MMCPNCGAGIRKTARYCPGCGVPVGGAVSPPDSAKVRGIQEVGSVPPFTGDPVPTAPRQRSSRIRFWVAAGAVVVGAVVVATAVLNSSGSGSRPSSPEALSVAFVRALMSGDDPDRFADPDIVDAVEADPSFPVFISMEGGDIAMDTGDCTLNDITFTCEVNVTDANDEAAMVVLVDVSVYGPDMTFDPQTGRALDPDGSPAAEVPPYVVGVRLQSS